MDALFSGQGSSQGGGGEESGILAPNSSYRPTQGAIRHDEDTELSVLVYAAPVLRIGRLNEVISVNNTSYYDYALPAILYVRLISNLIMLAGCLSVDFYVAYLHLGICMAVHAILRMAQMTPFDHIYLILLYTATGNVEMLTDTFHPPYKATTLFEHVV